VNRLRTILRLQRDEFLPLRVIRQELVGRALGSRKRFEERYNATTAFPRPERKTSVHSSGLASRDGP